LIARRRECRIRRRNAKGRLAAAFCFPAELRGQRE
jgi:hypothetical protein